MQPDRQFDDASRLIAPAAPAAMTNKEWQRAYRQKNREKLNAQQRERRRQNPERTAEQSRKQYWRRVERLGLEAMRAQWRAEWHKRYSDPAMRKKYAAMRGRGLAPTIPGEGLRRILGGNEIYAAAASAVPASLSPDVRDDVISSICLAVLEGEIEVNQIAKFARVYVRRHFRQFSKFTTISIDAKTFDNAPALIDRLEACNLADATMDGQ